MAISFSPRVGDDAVSRGSLKLLFVTVAAALEVSVGDARWDLPRGHIDDFNCDVHGCVLQYVE